jgi:y4mF family transcriptional regulator
MMSPIGDIARAALLSPIGDSRQQPPEEDDVADRQHHRGGSMGKKKSPSVTLSKAQISYLVSAGEIGKAVRSARDVRGITQSDLADKAKVHRSFVIDLENGKESLHIGKVLAVLKSAGLVGVVVPAEAMEGA